MAVVGDRIGVTSKGMPRFGVVTAVSGVMITVDWDTGGGTTFIPGPGVLTVVTARRRTPLKSKRSTPKGAKAAPKKAGPTGSTRRSKNAPSQKATAGKTPAAKKATGHSSVGFTLDKYGHLFPEADAELSGRLSGLYMVPKKADKDDSDEETQSPAASPRPDEVDEVAARRAKESLTRDGSGGASKNRTYDLSIISAAL